jgi:hypothetical protein
MQRPCQPAQLASHWICWVAVVSGHIRRARMRAMPPRGRWSQAQLRGLVGFCLGPAGNSRKADLLRTVELLTGQIAAACRLENQQLDHIAFWKTTYRAHIVALPALGHDLSERIPQHLLIRITYRGRLLARDLLFDRSIVRNCCSCSHAKEAQCSASKYAIRLTL